MTLKVFSQRKAQVSEFSPTLKREVVTWLISHPLYNHSSIDLINANFCQIVRSTFSSTCVRRHPVWKCDFIITLFIMMMSTQTNRNFFFLRKRKISTATFPRCENWQLWGEHVASKISQKHTHSRERWDWLSKLLRRKLMALKISPRYIQQISHVAVECQEGVVLLKRCIFFKDDQ